MQTVPHFSNPDFTLQELNSFAKPEFWVREPQTWVWKNGGNLLVVNLVTDGRCNNKEADTFEEALTSNCFIACCNASNWALVITSPFNVAGTVQIICILFRIVNH